MCLWVSERERQSEREREYAICVSLYVFVKLGTCASIDIERMFKWLRLWAVRVCVCDFLWIASRIQPDFHLYCSDDDEFLSSQHDVNIIYIIQPMITSVHYEERQSVEF